MNLKKASKSKVTELFNMNDYGKLAEEYDTISAQLKELSKRKEHLANVLKEGALKCGVKDDKGSYYCDCDNFVFGRVAKKSVKLNDGLAKSYLKEHNMEDMIKEVVTYEIDKEELSQAVEEGRIPQKDFEKLCDVDVSYSVSVKKKEEMAEVEQTTLKAVARKK